MFVSFWFLMHGILYVRCVIRLSVVSGVYFVVFSSSSACIRAFSALSLSLSSSAFSLSRCSSHPRTSLSYARLVISGSRCLPCIPRPCSLLIQPVRILILTHRREPEVAFVAPQPIPQSFGRRHVLLPRFSAVSSFEAAARQSSRHSLAHTSYPAAVRSCC